MAPASTGMVSSALDRGRPRDTHPLRRSGRQEVHSRRHGRTRLADRVEGARAGPTTSSSAWPPRAGRRVTCAVRRSRAAIRSRPHATPSIRYRRSSRATRLSFSRAPPDKPATIPSAARRERVEGYTNPDGSKFGACVYCGHCERFGCEANAKASPHITVGPIAMASPNFELRTHSWVTRVQLDSSKRKATGVLDTDVRTGEEFEQPASIVALCAYAINNVHLLLLSGIGTPYDSTSQKGVVGRNYCYQPGGGGVNLFFEDKIFNPFMASGAFGVTLDDFHANPAFDPAPVGVVGGATIGAGINSGRPIGYHPVPPGTPRWGADWKKAVAKWYLRAMAIGVTASNMPSRYNCYDLDPTYKNAFGLPLLRLTYNFTDNDRKILTYVGQKAAEIGRSLNATTMSGPGGRVNDDYTIVPYQSTHNTGGAVMSRRRVTALSIGTCRAGTSRTSLSSARAPSRTTRPTTRPAPSARSPIGLPTRSRDGIASGPVRSSEECVCRCRLCLDRRRLSSWCRW